MTRSTLLLSLVSLAVPTIVHAAEEKPRPPNVIVFLLDDMGWTDLGCYGSDLYETPNIDRLAKEGVKFTNAYAACTVCSPTRAALLTGKYPARLHITDWIPGSTRANAKLAVPDWTMYLPRTEVTIATALKKDGYATGHVGKWHLGNKEQGYADKHGFDFTFAGTERGQPPSYFSPYKIPTVKDGPEGEYLTDREAAEAIGFITANKDRPFFLYVPHHGVHTPLQAKKELIDKFAAKVKDGIRHKNATYAAMIASVDESVGKVTATLKELGLSGRTIVIFASDNGGLVLREITSNVPLRAGKGSAYEGGVRVPFIVKWPGVTKPGSVLDQPVITPDLYPTILEMTGAKGDPKHNAVVDGVSLVPLLRPDGQGLKREAIYWHYPHYHPGGATPYSAIRAGNWKLIEFLEDGRVELYSLGEDIGEKRDQSNDLPVQRKAMLEQLRKWRTSVGAQMPMPNPKFKPGQEE